MKKTMVVALTLTSAMAVAACEGGEEEPALIGDGEPTGEIQQMETPEVIGDQPGVTVAEVIESPLTYTGQTLTSEVRVTEVPTDRGFWIEDQGDRLFVIINDQPQEQPKHIQANTTISLSQATVRDPSYLPNLSGAPLDQQTQEIARNQEVFLVVDESNIQMMGSEGAMEDGQMEGSGSGDM